MPKIFASTNACETQRERENRNTVRRIAAEGMVLLENNGVLPLKNGLKNIALFGSGARRNIKGGTGSGDVNVRSFVTVEQGLENAGYTITTKSYLDRYDTLFEQANTAYTENAQARLAAGEDFVKVLIENPFKEPEAPAITAEEITASDTEVAVFVLSRNSGEGADRDTAKGDYRISTKELANIRLLTEHYQDVIVLLNTGGVIDMAELNAIDNIGAVLLMSQAGISTGDSVADILTGKVTPSGKLAMTWAASFDDYPYAGEFSHLNHDLDDSWYQEGIYVGYRYFDTFNITPAYPFGFGLSYTDFRIEPMNVSICADMVNVSVRVTNAGTVYSGREVVQVYVSAPDELLEKPYQELKGFGKTSLLEPGESEELTISFQLSSLASYSEAQAAWVLEAGEYFIRTGNSSRSTQIAAALNLKETVVTVRLKNLFHDPMSMKLLSKQSTVSYSYPGEDEEKEKAVRIAIPDDAIATDFVRYRELPSSLPEPSQLWTVSDFRANRCTLDELTACMSPEEMAQLCIGNGAESLFGGSIIGAAAISVPGASGETTSHLIGKYGIHNMVLADGPAGLHLPSEYALDKDGNLIQGANPMLQLLSGQPVEEKPEDATTYYRYCTAIPIATLLAQTWDSETLTEAGKLVGQEMAEFGVTLWLAPGMNIQRNPLCGRNFEYYSEDPIISGICAAAMTKGVQQNPGVGTTIKHFAGNNQEDNRYNCNSHISERALREIYLKGFEIAVRTAQPMAIMTAYNLLNGVHAANRYDLLTAVARDEWGFEGFIMTDWGTTGIDYPGVVKTKHKYPDADPAGCIAAGNDLIMPGAVSDYKGILAKLDKEDENGFSVTKAQLQTAAKNILRILLSGNCYEESAPYAPTQKLPDWITVKRSFLYNTNIGNSKKEG